MQKLSLTLVLLLFATASLLQAQNRSSQYDQGQIIINTLSGPIRNAVVYAPRPIWPAVALQQHLSGRGVYAIDLDTGIAYDVRVVHSTGHKILDDAAVDALLKWRFRRVVTGVTIPIEFGWTKEQTKPPTH
jgi:TonB family protein